MNFCINEQLEKDSDSYKKKIMEEQEKAAKMVAGIVFFVINIIIYAHIYRLRAVWQ